jgi:hypothetical protein
MVLQDRAARGPHGTAHPTRVEGVYSDDEVVAPLLRQANTTVFSVVREPIRRFISGLFHHTRLHACGGLPCPHKRRRIAEAIDMLPAHVFRISGYEHILPQSHFLRATDARGAALQPLVYKMETLPSWVFHANAKNASTTEVYLRALSDGQLRKLCDFFHHDFECLGYAMPPQCRQHQ